MNNREGLLRADFHAATDGNKLKTCNKKNPASRRDGIFFMKRKAELSFLFTISGRKLPMLFLHHFR